MHQGDEGDDRVSNVDGPASPDGDPSTHVAPRQAQILALIAEGRIDKEIATRLGVTVPTVRSHLHRFYKDNGIHNRVEAVMKWRGSSTVPYKPRNL